MKPESDKFTILCLGTTIHQVENSDMVQLKFHHMHGGPYDGTVTFANAECLDRLRRTIIEWQDGQAGKTVAECERQAADEYVRSIASTYEVRRSEDDGK